MVAKSEKFLKNPTKVKMTSYFADMMSLLDFFCQFISLSIKFSFSSKFDVDIIICPWIMLILIFVFSCSVGYKIWLKCVKLNDIKSKKNSGP